MKPIHINTAALVNTNDTMWAHPVARKVQFWFSDLNIRFLLAQKHIR
jgi:hypothetical protein